MKQSAKKLEIFLQSEYVNNPEMQSGDMSTAIRDLLTDLCHVGAEHQVNVDCRLLDAYEVYMEEAFIEEPT
jgi:hypothetical protein